MAHWTYEDFPELEVLYPQNHQVFVRFSILNHPFNVVPPPSFVDSSGGVSRNLSALRTSAASAWVWHKVDFFRGPKGRAFGDLESLGILNMLIFFESLGYWKCLGMFGKYLKYLGILGTYLEYWEYVGIFDFAAKQT